MKLLERIRRRAIDDPTPKRQGDESRLKEAETRANRLLDTAEWLQQAMAKRDAENHWQASVRQLFQGG